MQSYVIHFIRHGLTEGNLQGRYVGRTDLPLAPAGRAQLEKQRRAGGYPAAQAYEWMMDAGCGYSVRITPGLWMRSMVAEVYAQLPPREDPAENGGILNLAREAAARSYGGRDEEASRQEP